jgi:hypothetical protein
MRKVTGDVKQDAEIAGSNKRALIDSIPPLADRVSVGGDGVTGGATAGDLSGLGSLPGF